MCLRVLLYPQIRESPREASLKGVSLPTHRSLNSVFDPSTQRVLPGSLTSDSIGKRSDCQFRGLRTRGWELQAAGEDCSGCGDCGGMTLIPTHP